MLSPDHLSSQKVCLLPLDIPESFAHWGWFWFSNLKIHRSLKWSSGASCGHMTHTWGSEWWLDERWEFTGHQSGLWIGSVMICLYWYPLCVIGLCPLCVNGSCPERVIGSCPWRVWTSGWSCRFWGRDQVWLTWSWRCPVGWGGGRPGHRFARQKEAETNQVTACWMRCHKIYSSWLAVSPRPWIAWPDPHSREETRRNLTPAERQTGQRERERERDDERDDLILLAPTKEALQKQLDHL